MIKKNENLLQSLIRKIRLDCRGEITSGQFITIVIVLLGFGILLFLFYQLMWTDRVDRETCQQSVITRASFPNTANLNQFIPLKCNTQKFCITPDFLGTCDAKFGSSKDVSRVRVDNKEAIGKFLAGEMVDCWSMMGEGKVQLWDNWFNKNYGLGGVYSSCVICSRIAFDDSGFINKYKTVEAMRSNLDVDVIEYMRTHKVPEKEISYLDYLSGGKAPLFTVQDGWDTNKDFSVPSIDEKKKLVESFEDLTTKDNTQKVALSLEPANPSIIENTNNTKELAVLFMQISSPKAGEVFKNTFGDLGKLWLTSFVIAPTTTAKLSVNVATTAIKNPIGAVIVLGILGIGVGIQQAGVYSDRLVTAGYCGQVAIGSQARDGCSIVALTKYDINAIKKYCGVIESIA